MLRARSSHTAGLALSAHNILLTPEHSQTTELQNSSSSSSISHNSSQLLTNSMGKKRKVQHDYEVVVEESREPASYTIGGNAGEQQHQQQPKREQQQQQQEYENGYGAEAAGAAGDGYDAGGYDDYGGLLLTAACTPARSRPAGHPVTHSTSSSRYACFLHASPHTTTTPTPTTIRRWWSSWRAAHLPRRLAHRPRHPVIPHRGAQVLLILCGGVFDVACMWPC